MKENETTPWDADDVGNGRARPNKGGPRGSCDERDFRISGGGSGYRRRSEDPQYSFDAQYELRAALHLEAHRPEYADDANELDRSTSTSPPGFTISVSPSNFNFSGGLGETRQLTITAVPTSNLTSAVAFGEVRLTEGGNQAPEAHMTVAIKGEPFVVGAVSRKLHGATNHDIPLPLLGTPAVEPRTGPADGTHQFVVTFTSPVTLTGASVVQGTGTADLCPAGNDVIINVTGAPDVQRLVVRLANASNGVTTANVDIPVRLLAGDTNSSGGVTASDVGQTKAASSPGTVTPATSGTT